MAEYNWSGFLNPVQKEGGGCDSYQSQSHDFMGISWKIMRIIQLWFYLNKCLHLTSVVSHIKTNMDEPVQNK